MTDLSLRLLRAGALLLPMLIGISDALADSSRSSMDAQTAPVIVGAPGAPQRGDEALRAQVRHACAAILGLNPSESPYEACIGSLERSASGVQEAEATARRRLSCARDGLALGTPEFATCVVEEAVPHQEMAGRPNQ